MSESIEEYVQILISKNTFKRLSEQAELIEPSIEAPTADMVIARMLQNNDYLRDGDVALIFDFKQHCFDYFPISKLCKQQKKEQPRKKEKAETPK
jgi:hypothetical protein